MSGAEHSTPPTVTRGEIAELAGVRRPAVSNWVRRHRDFPAPVDPEKGAFDAEEVAVWLDRRTVPADALLPEEPKGTTYGARFRASLAERGRPVPGRGPEKDPGDALLHRCLDRLRGFLPAEEGLTVLLALVYLCRYEPALWQRVRALRYEDSPGTVLDSVQRVFRRWSPDGLPPLHRLLWHGEEAGRVLDDLARTVETLGRGESADAPDVFDRVLEKFSELPNVDSTMTTPQSVVRVMAEAVEFPSCAARVSDPFCRMGELLVAVADRARDQEAPVAVAALGATPYAHGLLIPRMHLAVHGVEAEVANVPGTTAPGRASERFDIVVTNPPFNMGRWSAQFRADDLPYGTPPERNANFGWLQHAVTALAPGGSAAVLMANNAAFSTHPAEREIRAAMVAARTVECLITLPEQLHAATRIGVTVWLLRPPGEAGDEVLFIDARSRGVEVSRTRRALRGKDVAEIIGELREWRDSVRNGAPYQGKPGFSRAVPLSGLTGEDCVLHPPALVGVPLTGTRDDAPGRLSALQRRLRELAERSERVDAEIADLLKGVVRCTP